MEEDTTRCEYTQGQRPEFVIKGGGYFSLRDPIEGPGNPSADRWLEAHSKFLLKGYIYMYIYLSIFYIFILHEVTFISVVKFMITCLVFCS